MTVANRLNHARRRWRYSMSCECFFARAPNSSGLATASAWIRPAFAASFDGDQAHFDRRTKLALVRFVEFLLRLTFRWCPWPAHATPTSARRMSWA